MFKFVKAAALILSSLAATTGAANAWGTSYSDQIAKAEADTWKIASVRVDVPTSLTVSEANLLAPNADIVWRGEPRGNRHAQVQKIITEAARVSTRKLSGNRPVHLSIRVQEFHAMTERARAIAPVGVHNISFAIQVFDARTGAPLTQAEAIQADLRAFTREQAFQADAQGLTQRVRIVSHVSNVLAAWMQQGPDLRTSFASLGR